MHQTTLHTLCYKLPEATGKTYTHHCGGAIFALHDHSLPVYHKRQFKTIQRKDMGNKMSLIYLKENTLTTPTLNLDIMKRVLTWYQWFDEEEGQKYYFVHQWSHHLSLDQQLDIDIASDHIRHDLRAYEQTPDQSLETMISVLYTAAALYGRRDTRIIQEETHLRSITIQLSLITQNMHLVQRRTQTHESLLEQWYFNTLSIQEHEDGATVQYTIQDEELLEHIAWFDLANDYHITKKSSTARMREQLIQWLTDHGHDASIIESHTVKFLMKQ